MTDQHSNPIGFLQEFVQKYNSGPFPEYVEMGSSGAPHCRQFTVQCSFGKHKVEAQSNSKKQAKSESARMLIDLLKKDGYFDKITHGTNRVTSDSHLKDKPKVAPSSFASESLSYTSRNPISLLQEHCQKNHIAMPLYEDGTSVGGGFIMVCLLDGIKTSAYSTSKKMAKTEAAAKMCIYLNLFHNDSVVENTNIEQMSDPKSKQTLITTLLSKSPDRKTQTVIGAKHNAATIISEREFKENGAEIVSDNIDRYATTAELPAARHLYRPPLASSTPQVIEELPLTGDDDPEIVSVMDHLSLDSGVEVVDLTTSEKPE